MPRPRPAAGALPIHFNPPQFIMTTELATKYDVNQDALDFLARGPKLLLIDNQ